MGTIGKDFNYIKVENFLEKEVLDILKKFTEIKFTLLDEDHFMPEGDARSCGEVSYYGDVVMDSILLLSKEKVEKHTNTKLLPTYSFWRVYSHGSYLLPHTDRPSCEISVTVHIDGDKEDWPIYFNDTPIETKPGDGIIYLGTKIKHSRKPFTGDYQTQLFLHYVNADGKFKEYEKDKRMLYGIMK